MRRGDRRLHGGSGGAKPPADSGNDPPTVGPVAEHGQLAVVGTQLRDQSGKPVQLKGVSSQWLNYESRPYPESKDGLAYARDHWKLSVIRAAMGTETNGGYLNSATGKAAMQDKVNTIIQNAIDLGIYVIVDWHTSAAVTATTTQQADAVAFFTDIAQRYGSTPNVIYEPFNEPRRVTWAQIQPYHEAVVAAIRAVDPDNLIVLGTPTFSQDVDIAAQDPVAGTNLLYTLHFYACTHKQPLRDKANAALGLGAPLFITEFGATPSDGGTPGNGGIVPLRGRSEQLVLVDGSQRGERRRLEAGSVCRHQLPADVTPHRQRSVDRRPAHQRRRRPTGRRRRRPGHGRPRPVRGELDPAVTSSSSMGAAATSSSYQSLAPESERCRRAGG